MGISGRLLQVVYISLADAHSWSQGLYVFPAAYVDSDVAALFSFQYTTGFEILGP